MNPTRILRSLLAERLGQTAGRWPRELFGEMEAPTLRQAIAERMTSPAPRAASPIETLEPRLADGPDAGAPVTSNASTAPDGGASGAGNQSAWARVKDAVLGRAPDIEANIWIGPRSALWDADRAARAEAMAQQGASPQEIWRETGTFRGSDGKWRQETGLVPFSRAYPNARAHVRREIFDQGGGSYAPIGPFNLISGTEPRALSHELNHLASRIEGFAPGGNPIRAGIEAKLRGEQFRGAYDRLPGEMDAERAAQRYHLNDEQRVERFPGVISREERMRQSAGLTQSPDGGASGAGNAYREQLRAEGFNVDEPVYHGTNADFEHFDPARASGQGMYGDGAGYFATAPQWANEFARGEGANVRQVYVRGNIFDTGRHTASHRGSPALIADYARLYQQKGMDFAASGIERHLQNGNFLAAYQQAVRDLGTFAELGYDGVRGASSLAGDEIVVFSPDNIAPRWRAPDAPNASPPSTGNGGRNGAALAALASLPPGALTLRELLRDHYRAA